MAEKIATNEKLVRVGIIVICGLLTLAGLGLFALHHLLFFIAVPNPSLSTPGKIYVTSEARQTSRYNREPARCGLLYTVNGKQYSRSTACVGFSSGADVTVWYSPDDPSDAVFDSRRTSYWFGIPGLLFGLTTYLFIRNFKKNE